MREVDVHNLVSQDEKIQKDLKSLLEIDTKIELIHEDKYINGIIADFTLIEKSSIRAIIECKAGTINITDYVRGIGQVMQYEYFNEKNITPKGVPYSDKFNSVLLFPSSVILNNSFNIGQFKYPESLIIVEINTQTNSLRKIEKKELSELSKAVDEDLTTISHYYIRDNRIFEIYILLRYLQYLRLQGHNEINRKKTELFLSAGFNTINNGNWRNAFITLSSLGFTSADNLPTEAGLLLSFQSFEEFAYTLYQGYINPFFRAIIDVFLEELNSSGRIELKNKDIVSKIKKKFGDRDVLFLTQSNGRYISSWLSIMRDDFGCIGYDSRNMTRELRYNPLELNKDAFIKKITENTIAKAYIQDFETLISGS